MEKIKIKDLLNLEETITKDFLLKYIYPWEVLSDIKNIVLEIGDKLSLEDYNKTIDKSNNPIWIHKSVVIENFVTVEGPTIISEGSILRHCAYIRGNVIIGECCNIGNSSEIKNAILFNQSKTPHFNYVGDSILGFKAHIGAGVKLSNFKSDGSFINIKCEKKIINTNLRKFGAILGDNVEIGCNSVTNPGTIIGRNSAIYPCQSLRGIIKENVILKSSNPLVVEYKK